MTRNARVACRCAVWVSLTAGAAALAQTPPDAGTLLRQTERGVPAPIERPAPAVRLPSPSTTPPRDAAGMRFRVDGVVVNGATLIQPLEVLRPLHLGRQMSFADLEDIGRSIAEAYRRAGWFARVLIPPQDITDAVVRFEVIESRLGAVRIDNGGQTLRADAQFIERSMTARQQPGAPLRMGDLERATALLNDTPGVAVTTALAPGDQTGAVDLVMTVRDRPLVSGGVSLDNQGTRSMGRSRLGLNLFLDNPSGEGDQAALGAVAAQGTRYLRLGYSVRAGIDGGRFGMTASHLSYHVMDDELAALNARGSARTLSVVYTYPFERSNRGNMRTALGVERRTYDNQANGAQVSAKQADVLTLDVNGDENRVDVHPGYAWQWDLSLVAGRLDLSDNPASAAADALGPRTQGRYLKLAGSAARLQWFGPETSLWGSLSAQWGSRNLDSSEKLSLGGRQAVRAYSSLAANGDVGAVAVIELRRNITPTWQGTLFYDHGTVRLNRSTYAGASSPQRVTLSGWGLGLSWNPAPAYSLRLEAARGIGTPSASDTDDQQVWFSGIFRF